MINAIRLLGWLISIIVNVSFAIPFYFVWNWTASKYFYFLPEVYKVIPFWDCVWLFIAISILKHVLIPKIVEVSQENKK